MSIHLSEHSKQIFAKYESEQPMKYVLSVSIIAIIAFSISISSFFTLSEDEYAVLTQFGKPSRTIMQAGLYIKRPFFWETVHRIDRRNHIFSAQPIQLLMGDKNPLIVTCYICWRVSDPQLYFQSIVDQTIARQKLGDMISSQLGSVLGGYNLTDIINPNNEQVKLSQIESEIMQAANNKTEKLYGITVVQLGVRKIEYPSIVAKAVFNRMRSEREKEAMKYRAEGMEKAAVIKAKADRQAKEIVAEAKMKAAEIKAEGDQKALQIFADTYAKDPDLYEYIKSLELYKEILQDNTTIILSTDSKLFKHLGATSDGQNNP
jgi:membrane protease subunit HflC